LEIEDRLTETERPNPIPSPLGKLSGEEHVLRLRVLEEELRKYKAKCDLLLRYMNDAAGVIQKMETHTQRAPRIEMMGKAMVAGLAHDLRNPLAVIQSCAQTCLEAENLSGSLRKDLEMIQESSHKANSLLAQFLDFVKSGLDRQSTDLNELLLRAWEVARLGAKSTGVTLETRLSPALPLILADPEKLERVFVNLFLNALQAVPPGGRITVQTHFQAQENSVQVEVIDDGPGIPLSRRNRLFEPFSSTRKDGVGLGLFLCQTFVRDHGGEILIEGGETGGTKVTIKLPVDRENTG
jgi:two-component system, NtrC family, sensor histidine kinase HydH